ncbi:MAG: two-component regulator propeller domain-containing protein [Ferruginibacter sp.]
MHKTYLRLFHILHFFFCLIVLNACNNSDNLSFPENELGQSQPKSVPLVFSTPKKLTWDTAYTTGITAITTSFDIDALPVFSYDSTGFKTYLNIPEEVPMSMLSSKDFSLENIPSQPLNFKTSALGIVPTIKAGNPELKQEKALAIYNFGKPSGLLAKFIVALYKDHNGHLWIGSSEGLFRYDGDHIQSFVPGSSTDPPIIGITEDIKGNIWFIRGSNLGMINIHAGSISYSDKIGYTIRCLNKMVTDAKGNIWVYNLRDKAVSVINPVTQTFKNIDGKKWLSDSSIFQNNPVPNDLQIQEDDDKNIWITTLAGGVDIIDATAGKIKYLRKSNGLGSDSVTAITKDNTGKIWVGFATGVDAIDLKNQTITHYNKEQGFVSFFTTWLYFDDKGYLWRGCFTGIDLVDIRNHRARQINESSGLNSGGASAIVQDKNNRTWISSITGLNMIDQNGETVSPLATTTQIICSLEDSLHNLWIGTQAGVLIVNPQRDKMHLLDKSGGLSDNFVQSFWKKDGNIIIATDGGYNIIDPVNKTLTKAGKAQGLLHDTIYAALHDASGNLWLTGPGKGISLLDPSKKVMRYTDAARGLSDNTIMDLKQDKNGLIWLATNNDGINVINPADGTVKYLNNQPGLSGKSIRILHEDTYGRMWIGTNKGIYVADTKHGTLTSITTKEGLSSNTILSLLPYNGSILAGTKNKITIIKAPAPADSASDWKISILQKSEGIIKQNNSWSTDAITHDGKYLYGDKGITIINQITPESDLAKTSITGMSILGQPQFFNGSYSDTLYPAKPEFKWDNVSGPYNLPGNLSIPNTQNYLQFQFKQEGLIRADTILYSYFLEGIDKSWSTPAGKPFTENYLNLPPGKYTLNVNSKGSGGKWGKPAAFSFTITPPWYKTWWAYTLFALILIGLLRAYIVFRSRRLKNENKILEEKVKHRTQQLQQSLEDLKSTQSQLVQSEKMASLGELTAGIAHEIQNPLNFVNNFSEVNNELIEELKNQNATLKSEEREGILDDIFLNNEKINFHGKRADAIVKGMLQHSRSSSGVKEPTDINALCDEYLRLSYHGLRAKDKSFNATIKTDFDETLSADEAGIGNINIIPQDIGRVILNLLTNAFYAVDEKKKSGIENYEPTVTISTSRYPFVGLVPSLPIAIGTERAGVGLEGLGEVRIKVTDNGNGIPQKVLDKIFQPFFTTKPTGQGTGLGLSLSYDIVKAHGGELKVETLSAEAAAQTGKQNEGTTFIIQLPVK